MSFNAKLTAVLKTDKRFIVEEGELLIAAVRDRAWQVDHDLVKLLLSDKDIKAKFFDEIAGHWVFNLNTFIEYISQKNFLDNSYTRFRNRIGLTIGDKYLRERGDVALAWPYKDCILEGGQTRDEESRKEIFFNEVIAEDEINRLLDPKVLTSFVRYTSKGKQPVKEFKRDENGIIRENLIFKGNNLLALHTLKTQFRGQIKLVYIDPPFNTASAANTFAYNNSFNHSTWLSFMKTRVEAAREMLRKDGIFVVAIDHYELFYLGVLCDEVFGRENRMGVISVVHNPGGRQDDIFFPTAHENMLFYANDITSAKLNTLGMSDEKLFQFRLEDSFGKYKLRGFRRSGNNSRREQRRGLFYPIYYNPTTNDFRLKPAKDYLKLLPIDEQGIERCWRWGPETFMARIEKYIEVKSVGGRYDIYIKEREGDYEGEKPKTIWNKSKYSGQTATSELKKLFGEKTFSYPKSPFLIMDVVKITTAKNDIVLDFFGGSGTTAHGVLELNKEDGGSRQYILCEQMGYADSITVERVKRVMKKNKSGDFIFCELMKYNEAFMERIESAKTSKELLKIWREMAEDSFLNWYVNPRLPEDAIKDFEAIGKEENGVQKQKRLLAELLDKNQLYVNLSEIDDAQFKVSAEDKALNKAFYGEAYNA
ncbi:MAG TPA: site-specific DNA-methyltransferase [Phycisphaerae bacterium]|nr:site-specific DNA-methyltransferase [Phycisphaerae bacterium]